MLNRLNWLFVGSLILSACSVDPSIDLDPPHIEVNDPADGSKAEAGSYILFNALFSDNQALGTFSIDIHNAFDGHSHGRIQEDPDLIKFSFRKNYDLPPVTAHLIALPQDILVPAETQAGPYHFIVQAIDAEGNATSYQDGSIVENEILIINESMARIDITNLVNGELEISGGTPFDVEGSITDPPHPTLQGFEMVHIILGEPEEGHSHDHARTTAYLFESTLHNSELTPYFNPDGSLDIAGMINYTPDESELAVLESEEVEHLELMVEVHDLQGNITIEKVAVHIHFN